MKTKTHTFIKHPLFLLLVSGLITIGIGTWLTSFWAKQNLMMQIRLEIYKDDDLTPFIVPLHIRVSSVN
jgi:hypothetical protein